MPRPSLDEVYLGIAELMSSRGTCARRQVGCILVDAKGRILAAGYNGVASGRPHCIDHPCPGVGQASGQGLDSCEAIHAEQNAVLLLPDPWKVHTAYVTVSPCISCVKLLLGTSCRRIVCRGLYAHGEATTWWHRAGREMVVLEPKNKSQ